LYVVSGTTIYILKAYPANQAQTLSKIELETYGAQIYVNDNKLVILGNRNWFYTNGFIEEAGIGDQALSIYPYIHTEEMYIKTYDISDRTNPTLSRTLIVNGTLSGSRMIDDYVYLVVNQPIIQEIKNETDLNIILPKISGDQIKEIQPNQIRYIDVPDVYYRLTTILAINVEDDTQNPTYESFLASQTTNMYVSLNNMYLVVPNTNLWFIRDTANEVRDETLIYRIKLDQEKITTMAEGSVTGYILNQYSMDEYNSHFRVATTEWKINGSINSLFLLDMNMKLVGQIRDLAEGESIYSARFMGDRCYLVTFRQIDPFFVIDVTNPNEPKVLGYLKIPGFSGYLHPYDQNHIIGIGKEDNNLKLSLFDVTDVSTPTEQVKYLVKADWSDSLVLWDSKAFLFEKPQTGIDRIWIIKDAPVFRYFFQRFVYAKTRAIGSVGRYAFDNIGHTQNPGFQEDLFPCEALRVSGAVHLFMMLQYNQADRPGKIDLLQYFKCGLRMVPDQLNFYLVQLPGFA